MFQSNWPFSRVQVVCLKEQLFCFYTVNCHWHIFMLTKCCSHALIRSMCIVLMFMLYISDVTSVFVRFSLEAVSGSVRSSCLNWKTSSCLVQAIAIICGRFSVKLSVLTLRAQCVICAAILCCSALKHWATHICVCVVHL